MRIGPSLAVTRPQPPATAAVGPVSGLAGSYLWWLRSDLGITTSAGVVTTWANQIGSDTNKDATDGGNAARRPTYTASNASYNNKPSLDFTGASMKLATGVWAAAPTQPFMLFVVGHAVLTASHYYVESLNGPGNVRLYENGVSGLAGNAGAEVGDGLTGAATIICVEFNGASSNLHRNKRSASASGNMGTNTPTGFHVGNDSTVSTKLNGPLLELLAVSGNSSADKTAILSYLETRYAIALAA